MPKRARGNKGNPQNVSRVDKEIFLDVDACGSGKKATTISKILIFLSMLNFTQGMGTLVLPYAISTGGYLVIISILVIAALSYHSSKVIIRMRNEYNQRVSSNGHAELANALWGRVGSVLVNFTEFVYFFGACMLCILLVSNFFEINFPDVLHNKRNSILCAGVFLIPTVFISRLRQLYWLNSFSVCFGMLSIIILVIESLYQVNLWKFKEPLAFNEQYFWMANGIVLFTFSVHPFLCKMDKDVDKVILSKLTTYAFGTSTCLNIIFGMILAFCFGDTTKELITNNLGSNISRKVISGFLAFVGYYSYPMSAASIANIVQCSDLCKTYFLSVQACQVLTWKEKYLDIIMRSVILLFTVLAAAVWSKFYLLMVIIGCVPVVLLAFVYPLLFHFFLDREANGLVFVIGIFCSVFVTCIGLVYTVIHMWY